MEGSKVFPEPDHPVLASARAIAAALGHSWVGPEHMLLALLATGDPGVLRLLDAVGIALDAARAALLEALPPGTLSKTTGTADLPYTSRATKVLRLVAVESLVPGESGVKPVQFLRSIVRENRNIAAEILFRLGMPGRQEKGSLRTAGEDLKRAGLNW